MRKRLLVVPAGISLVAGTAGTATASAGQAARPGPMASAPAAFFDSRVSAPPRHATVTQTAAVRGMARATGGGARITYDPLFGTPRQLLRNGGYLTGPANGSAVGVARSWLTAHRAAFGLSAAGVRALVVSCNDTNPTSRTHVITFTQVFGGLQAVAAMAHSAAPRAAYRPAVAGKTGIWTRFVGGRLAARSFLTEMSQATFRRQAI